ncbi:uncharacterized protein LOC103517322 [Diaphorina citri]|uniref:Uncharacterized protein LOC103517322 n=1 Tax=Diaphorina citri TaxID=121845 RepID=A0A3Q0J9T1_DIACI|nr:uncharacterized protein LOC103517322 [Diaphorina citri]
MFMCNSRKMFSLFSVVLAQPLLQAPSGCPEPYGVQTYPHPQLCDQFYKCTNGTLTLEQCENGLLYDGNGNVHNHCNYYWGVDCGNRKADCKLFCLKGRTRNI